MLFMKHTTLRNAVSTISVLLTSCIKINYHQKKYVSGMFTTKQDGPEINLSEIGLAKPKSEKLMNVNRLRPKFLFLIRMEPILLPCGNKWARMWNV